MKKFILLICASFLFLTLADPAQAVCSFNLSGNQDIDGDCNLNANTTDGLDDASNNDASTTNSAILTLLSGTLTIPSAASPSSTTTLVVGSLNLSGGNIAMGSTNSQIKLNAPKYCIDTDSDGYARQLTFFTATESGRRRCSLMHSLANPDCDDTDTNTGAGDLATYYQDLDGDTYGNSSVSQSSCSPPAGYVANSTDCYDADPGTTNAELAYPGSSTCSGSNRGDGSFDYNCSSTQTTCGTTYDRSCAGSGSFGGARCIGAMYDKRCGSYNRNYYHNTQSIGCGVAACYCSGTGSSGYNCTSDGDRCYMSYTGTWCTDIVSGTQNCQ